MKTEEQIDIIKNRTQNVFLSELGSIKNRYLIKDILPLKFKYLLKSTIKYFSITDERIDRLENYERYEYCFSAKIQCIAKLDFALKNGQTSSQEHEFKLFLKGFFNNNSNYIGVDIYDENKLFISDYYEHIFNSYVRLGLKTLVDEGLKFDNKNAVTFFIDIIRKNRNNKIIINDFAFFDDIARMNQDIRHHLTLMAVTKPYISNYLENPFNLQQKTYYKYFPTIYDKHYLMCSSILVEFFYNYWDKLGDLLFECFKLNLKSNKVYFLTVMKQLSISYLNSKNFVWLDSFRRNHYSKLNKMRKMVVHYKSIESDHHNNYQGSFDSEKKLQKLQNEKEKLHTFFLEFYDLSINGFEYCLKLIDEIQ